MGVWMRGESCMIKSCDLGVGSKA
ncbi:rCG48455 [Rattus norvegicus]|uniref:RCG48455 n=1 Tax=Rattus norvegicus TaxID=10116 RepID=A6I0L0_RAT|nr:rCG48455 [Rattus norvegicus]